VDKIKRFSEALEFQTGLQLQRKGPNMNGVYFVTGMKAVAGASTSTAWVHRKGKLDFL
jgi:hypothetical protein